MADTVQTWSPALAGPPRPTWRGPAAAVVAPALDHRVPDVPAADPDHRQPRHLSSAVLDLSVDAEPGADPFHRARQFPLPAVARRIPDGGRAVGDLRAVRRILQSADRAHHRTLDQQPADQRPAQMARHAAGPLGDSAGAVVARLVVAVRPDALGVQLDVG